MQSNPHHSGVTFKGEPHMTLGGVGRNLAAAMELLGLEPLFLTSLADDNLGQFARNEMANIGFQLDNRQLGGPRMRLLKGQWESSCFALVLIDSLSGQCEYVIANLDATGAISHENLRKLRLGETSSTGGASAGADETLSERLERTPLVVLDANLGVETTGYLLELCSQKGVPVFMEPTDVVCLARLVDCLRDISRTRPASLNSLAFMSPNVVELEELVRLFEGTNEPGGPSAAGQDRLEFMARRLMETHMSHLKCLLVTMDKRGVLVAARTSATEADDLDNCKLINGLLAGPQQQQERLSFKHYKPARIFEKPVSASGAGDCFAAGFISGLIRELPLKTCIELAFNASACALNDKNTVPLALKRLAPPSR